jgi:glycosyltransferase involved in cell wall biosynthesis
MKNKFIIITTCYNVEPYIQMNIYMNKFQTYQDVLYVYVDDNSKDTTYDTIQNLIKDDNRFLLIKNTNNGSQGKAFMYAIDYLEQNKLISDQDIIVEVDGDDWLSSPFVLEYLNQIYQYPSIWMTYGQYQIYPTGQTGGHYHMDINDNVNIQNKHRLVDFPYSHLKTYKYWLFNKINRNDLIDPSTGEIFSAAWDHVLCLPMVEMAGKEHIYRFDEILYILNRSEELQNEGRTRSNIQKETEQRCRQQNSYLKITPSYITCHLLGPGNPGGKPNFGLGNMLFQIATLCSLAKDNNAIAVFPNIERHEFGNYSTSLLNKIYTILPDINLIENAESPFEYHDLKYTPNSIYKGYFQSEKYFIHNRDYILNLFKNQNIINQVKNIYPEISNNSVSLHVRHGDYVNLQEFHPIQTIDYYNQALEYIKSYENIFVFSDDIEWCKKNLRYKNLIFVENQTDVFDLMAMSLCTHNIIANSTFSWWGAWLNENPNKIVIAPKAWFGNKRNLSSQDIIPKNWVII